MSLSNWRLCARLLTPLVLHGEDLVVDQGGPFVWFYKSHPDGLPTWHGTRIGKAGYHFPYGFEVHPD